MLTSTVFNLLLVVGVFLTVKCQAQQPFIHASGQASGPGSARGQELEDEDLYESLSEIADEIAQESRGGSHPELSNEKAVVIRRRVIREVNGNATVSCPFTYRYRLSCGLRNLTRGGGFYSERRYAYPYGSRSCRCYASQGYCTAWCTNKPVHTRIVSRTAAGIRRVLCPYGYKVLGCHGQPYTSDETESYTSYYPLIYPSSSSYYGRVCACYSRHTFRCVASCAPRRHFRSYEIRYRYGRERWIKVSCPAGTLLGCGIKPRYGSTEKYRAYYQYGDSCACTDLYNAHCFAICGQFA